jgi:hypothetical protein
MLARKMDYSMSALAYDANGNILNMTQKGFKVGRPASAIDILGYTHPAKQATSCGSYRTSKTAAL